MGGGYLRSGNKGDGVNEMTLLKSLLLAVLDGKGWVSNADFESMGLLHIGRNRITDEEAREYFKGKRLKVHFVAGETFLENRWVLEPILREDALGVSELPCKGAAQAAEVASPPPYGERGVNQAGCGGSLERGLCHSLATPAPTIYEGRQALLWDRVVFRGLA